MWYNNIGEMSDGELAIIDFSKLTSITSFVMKSGNLVSPLKKENL